MAQELTDKERIEKLSREEKNRAAFAALQDALSLIDLTKNKNITYQTYSRDSLRTYLKNPASEGNQKSLRKLSNYLYTVSHVYRKIVNNKVNQLTCEKWTAYPKVNENGEIDGSVFEHYNKVCNYVENMHLDRQIKKCLRRAWLDDVCYAFTYGNPEDDEFFLHILPADYCKISSQQYYGGQLNFAFDCSFFDSGTNSYYLDVYDPVFKKAYNKYKSDNTQRWVELPIERTFCIKINDDNLDFPIPPFCAMFDSLISLCDLQQVQDVKDEMSAYKLINLKIPLISGTKDIDDFAIDLDLSNQFYSKIMSVLPPNVAATLGPFDIDTIDFKSNTAEDTNIISSAYQNLVEANGDIICNTSKITNSTSYKLALMADSFSATAPVTQINTWVNLYIKNNLGIEDVIVEYSNVSPYFEEDRIKTLKEAASLGIPCKTELASMLGLNPAKCRSMEYLEEKLGLSTTKWTNPLVSSNTQSADANGDGSDGRPEKDDGDLSDEGEATRDGNKNDN